MNKDKKIHILRVFVNSENKFGNPVGIILDQKQEISTKDRQGIATRLGFSESVFVNKKTTGNVSIFNPKKEVDFAGHALVGTAYFITNCLGKPVTLLQCRGGSVLTWQENDCTWIRASLKHTPAWNHEQLRDASSVKNLSTFQIRSKKHTMVWAWIDQSKGIIRACTFAPDWGIPEDEANGSGSMQLAAMLAQKLEIYHGKGSVIFAKPSKTGSADVGGKIAEDPSQKIIAALK